MFKRLASSNKRLVSKSAYAIALTLPFISFAGETKASKIIPKDNQLLVENKENLDFQVNHQYKDNKFKCKKRRTSFRF